MCPEWVSVGVNALTLLVLFFTLLKVGNYAKAAWEQAEAQQKPCVVVLGTTNDDVLAASLTAARGVDPTDDRALSQRAYSLVLRIGDVLIENIGPGPAIGICLKREKRTADGWNLEQAQIEVGSLAPREAIRVSLLGDSAFPKNGREYRLTTTFSSLSGRAYVMRQEIQDRVLGRFEFGPAKEESA